MHPHIWYKMDAVPLQPPGATGHGTCKEIHMKKCPAARFPAALLKFFEYGVIALALVSPLVTLHGTLA